MKHIMIMLMLTLCSQYAIAADGYFTKTGGGNESVVGDLANEDGLAYDRSFYLYPDSYAMPKISAVVTYTSTTYSAVTFSSNSYSLNGSAISILSHGLDTGVKVAFTNGSGTSPDPLTETDYYVAKLSDDSLALATTKANAVAGTYVVLTSSTSGDNETYTLTPAAISGTPSFKWQGANENGDVFDIAIQDVSITEYTYGGAVVGFNFGDYNYSALILNVTAPTTGGLEIKAKINMKK